MRPQLLAEENPFERETEQLLNREGNRDLQSVSKIMALSRDKNLAELQSYIEQITDDPDKQFNPESLKAELQFLKHFYKSIENNEPINPEIFKHNQNGHSYRTKTLNINMKLKKGEHVIDEEITEILQILQDNPQLKQQFLMKMLGSVSVQRLLSISIQQIEDLTEDLKKRAIKLQIAADWKYFVELDEEALNFKAECVRVWEKINLATQIKKSKKEFEELRILCKKQKIQTPYTIKLQTIRKIVSKVKFLPDLSPSQLADRKKRKVALSIILPHIIKSLQIPQNEKKMENSIVTTSILKKVGIVQERREIGKKFYEQASKNHFFYANYITQNRFSFQLLKRLMLILGIMDRIYKKRCRIFWQNANKS